jgi:hypothetical protein
VAVSARLPLVNVVAIAGAPSAILATQAKSEGRRRTDSRIP